MFFIVVPECRRKQYFAFGIAYVSSDVARWNSHIYFCRLIFILVVCRTRRLRNYFFCRFLKGYSFFIIIFFVFIKWSSSGYLLLERKRNMSGAVCTDNIGSNCLLLLLSFLLLGILNYYNSTEYTFTYNTFMTFLLQTDHSF